MHVRLWVMVRDGNAPTSAPASTVTASIGYGNNQLTVRAIKITADGALGSRGAWLLEPYADKPDSTGLGHDAGRDDSRGARRSAIDARLSGLRARDRRSRATAKC